LEVRKNETVSSETSVKRKSELNLPGGADKTMFAQGDVDQVPFAKGIALRINWNERNAALQ